MRGVWVDYLCAQMGLEDHDDEEMYTGAGIAVRYVSTSSCAGDVKFVNRMKTEGRAEVYEKDVLSTMSFCH